MNRRELGILACMAVAACARRRIEPMAEQGLLIPPVMPSADFDQAQILKRICFGSCYVPQFEEPDIWRKISAHNPDAFLFIGDNVYQSEENGRPELRELREAYTMLANDAPFAGLRAATPVLTTWDDHDYGMNDAGAEFPARLETEALFKHVWAVPPEDPRYSRKGVYFARTVGPVGRRTQLIVLDTRYFRTDETMLGDAQWRWLESVLAEDADIRILASSIQVLTHSKKGESWTKWSAERERLMQMLDRAKGAVIVSGDSHFGAHYRREDGLSYPLLELTSSSLNFPMPETAWAQPGFADEPRVGEVYYPANFGAVEIDWEKSALTLSLHNDQGEKVSTQTIALELLHPA